MKYNEITRSLGDASHLYFFIFSVWDMLSVSKIYQGCDDEYCGPVTAAWLLHEEVITSITKSTMKLFMHS